MPVSGPNGNNRQPYVEELKSNQTRQQHRSKNPIKWLGRRISKASKNSKTGYTNGALKGLRQVMLGNSHSRFRDQKFTSILARSPLFIPGACWGIARGLGEGLFGAAKGLITGKSYGSDSM